MAREAGFERTSIYGIDFSGGTKASDKIWIAKGTAYPDGLHITECFPAKELPYSGAGRKQSTAAIRDLIRRSPDVVFGLDFPFGLPEKQVMESSWEEFVTGFEARYSDPDVFRSELLEAQEGREPKRRTDEEARTPFAPTNIRIIRQTYFGIKELLAPLVSEGKVSVLPMERPDPNLPWVIEVCPACTLKKLNLYLSYKGKSDFQRSNRARILGSLVDMFALTLANEELNRRVVEDSEGDALDSVIAAQIVYNVLPELSSEVPAEAPYNIEGRVYY